MKKFLIATLGLGLVVVSCGTKESTMTSKNADSASVNAGSLQPSTADTLASPRMNPDTVKIKTDSTAVVAPAK